MALNVYLNFDGDCRDAVEFYAKVFETEEPEMMTFGEAPPEPDYPMPVEAANRIMHANININGTKIMFSDVFPGMPFVKGNNISLTVISNEMGKIKGWFNQLKEGGTVEMDLQETFWSKCYGSVVDKFGIPWQLNYEENDNL